MADSTRSARLKEDKQLAQPPCSSGERRNVNSTPETNTAVLDAIAALRTDIDIMKAEICATIDARIETVTSTLRSEISALRQTTESDISKLQVTATSHSATQRELERGATHTSDLVVTLEKEVKRLSAVVKSQEEKCESLEGFSRRSNVRIFGVEEGKEMPDPRQFVSGLLKEALGLADKPLLDRAHRSLQTRPKHDEPPRPIIAKCHYFHNCEEILRRVRETDSITYQGQKLRIYQDLPPSVTKRRAAFAELRRILRGKSGVKYVFLYPARFRVTIAGQGERRFTDAGEALAYVKQHVSVDKG